MAYSGTVGLTVVSVQDLIDHGARRSGKLAEELTSEQVLHQSSPCSSCFLIFPTLASITGLLSRRFMA